MCFDFRRKIRYVYAMKILLVSDYAVPRGGNEVVTLSLRDGLRTRGHDVRLFASRAFMGRERGTADYECFGTGSSWRAATWCANPSAYLRLRRVLDEFRPDVVHVRLFLSQLSPLILPLLRDVPAIYHDGWYRTVCPVGSRVLPSGAGCVEPAGAACYRSGCVPAAAWPLLMLQLRLWRRWRRVFDAVVANSQAVAEWLHVDDGPAVKVVPNGVKAVPFRPPLSDPPLIVYAGRLSYEKGVDTLLQAFALVVKNRPEARLLIAGEGEESERLRQMAQPLGGAVEFLGHRSRDTVERRFQEAWVQVVPSRGREAFGNAAAEAMMRGTALVATAAGGFLEYVRHEQTGILIPPDDPATLAQVLTRLCEDRAAVDALGQAGCRFAREIFDYDRFLDRFEQIYREVIDLAGRT